jgi:hypothetical protein
VLVAALVTCLWAPAGASAGDLDQQQTLSNGARGIVAGAGAQSGAQTFTAGRSGLLDQVDLDIDKGGSPLNLTVELRDVVTGQPGTQVLASASLPASGVPLSPAHGFVPIPFPVPGSVTAGTQYAIVAYTASSGSNFYHWWDKNPDQYAGGMEFVPASSPPVAPWGPVPAIDFAFKTYVAPPASPATTPPSLVPAAVTGLRAAALRKCKRKHTRRARRKCRRRANRLPV